MSAEEATHSFNPRGTALQIFKVRAREVLVAGPAGTGKSRACLEKVLAICLAKPGVSVLIVRKTAKSLSLTTLVTWEKFVIPEVIATGYVKWYGGSASKPAGYYFSNGSIVMAAGMDNPDKIMSAEYDVIFVDEATDMNITDWELMTTRLRNGVLSYQQLLAACNPQGPSHFLKRRADTGALVMLESRHIDNPRFYDENGEPTEEGKAYIASLDNLTGIRKLRLRYGAWAGAEGLIFDEFDPAIHLVDEMPPGWEQWRRFWTVDFGFTNPFVCQFWAVDPDGRMYLYREIYKTKTLVEDHAKQILDLVAPLQNDRNERVWTEPKPSTIICDHDAEDRATLEKHLGLPTNAAHKAVSTGIEATQMRFRRVGDGKPRIFFLRSALVERDQVLEAAGKPTRTTDELLVYIWNEGKDQPVKEHDHGCDAMRYGVAREDLQAQHNIRWLS